MCPVWVINMSAFPELAFLGEIGSEVMDTFSRQLYCTISVSTYHPHSITKTLSNGLDVGNQYLVTNSTRSDGSFKAESAWVIIFWATGKCLKKIQPVLKA